MKTTVVTRSFVALGSVLLAAGCDPAAKVERVATPGQVVELEVNGKKVQAELAIDDDSRTRGLMFRESMAADAGMLFIWPEHGGDRDYRRSGDESGLARRSFWMRNTTLPLSIAFIADDGKILQIEDLRPKDERHVMSKDEVRFALEMNQGWFQKNGIGPGAVINDFPAKVGKLEVQ